MPEVERMCGADLSDISEQEDSDDGKNKGKELEKSRPDRDR